VLPVVEEHHYYLADQMRIAAFRHALDEAVKPGDVVLDLGAGTGILGLLACQAGAKRVYAIEQGGMIELARQLCQANGFQDRVVFIKGLSTQVNLPERVDVVVADQIGWFGFEAGLLKYFRDARRRFLKPDGVMIPSRVDLYVAPVEYPQGFETIEFWNNGAAGFDFRAVRTVAVNTVYPVKFGSEHLLASPTSIASLDLSTAIPNSLQLETSVVADKPGILHGIGGWFAARLSANVVITNGPRVTDSINRRNVFLPIDRPVPLAQGDRIQINLHILPTELVVTWKVDVQGSPQTPQEQVAGASKGQFTHSTWKGMLICREDLQKTRSDFIPTLSPWGKAWLLVLRLCDAQKAVSEIEQDVYLRYPELFSSPREASAFVAKIVTRYSV
jgi:SAM-dependent methyltransferase